MRRIISTIALAAGIVLVSTTAAFACEQSAPVQVCVHGVTGDFAFANGTHTVSPYVAYVLEHRFPAHVSAGACPIDQGVHVFIFCGPNAIDGDTVVRFTGGPRGWTRLGGIGEPTWQDASQASPFTPVDVNLGHQHGLVEAGITGQDDQASRSC